MKTSVLEYPYLIKLQALKKETLVQVLSCEFCKIFKNGFFTEYLRWLLDFWLVSYRLCIMTNISLKKLCKSAKIFKLQVAVLYMWSSPCN